MLPASSPRSSSAARLAAIAFAAFTAAACAREETAPFAGDPVLVVAVDSLAASHVSCYGYARPTTPNADALAARGARFATCYSQTSWTLPSVASLFTGIEQELHGLRERDASLPDGPTTLAELFAAAGYRTSGIVQTPILRSATGVRRGFEHYRVLSYPPESAERAVELALEALAAPDPRPPFVYLHLSPPHMPYQPPAPFRGRFAGESVDDTAGSIDECRRIHRAGLPPDHPDVVRLSDLYDENVAFADELLGRVVRGLDPEPRLRRALVVFTSDHGEAFMQHGAQGHCTSVHEEMVRVPLLIAALDGRISPRTVGEPASLLDLAPTLAELCGLGAPRQRWSGQSLAIALGDAPSPPPHERRLFLSSRYRPGERDLELAVREGDLKLVHRPGSGALALYDLARDPGERNDVAARRPEVVARLRESLDEFLAQRAGAAPALARPVAEDERAALEELGYAGDE